MKTITIYELLGMIKDGKELPKKIKVLDVVYEFDDHYGDYYNKSLDRFLFVYMTSEEEWKLAFFLNMQVEILEEEKKIPEKLEYYDDSIAWVIDDVGQLSDVDKVIIDKLNDIIDYLKNKGE